MSTKLYNLITARKQICLINRHIKSKYQDQNIEQT